MSTVAVPHMETLELRPTTGADLDWVVAAELHPANSPFVNAWPRERHETALGDPDIAHWIAESADGERVGFVLIAGLERADRRIELRRVVVTDKARGFGREILRRVKRFAFDERRARCVWLDVMPTNTRARKLYEREGFRVDESIPAPDDLVILSIRVPPDG